MVNDSVLGSRLQEWLSERLAASFENLKIRPMNLGESRESETVRVWSDFPVTIKYEVSLSNRRVRVTAVRLTGF